VAVIARHEQERPSNPSGHRTSTFYVLLPSRFGGKSTPVRQGIVCPATIFGGNVVIVGSDNCWHKWQFMAQFPLKMAKATMAKGKFRIHVTQRPRKNKGFEPLAQVQTV
jgi:hypothetical protein